MADFVLTWFRARANAGCRLSMCMYHTIFIYGKVFSTNFAKSMCWNEINNRVS